MKSAVRFAASLLALGGLLGSVASQATDIAQLPLKASVLAKPNVIFAMDDSGSMDWEVLLNTNSGLVYWNGSSSWNSTTAPLTYNDTYVPYAYLLPVGTATGGALYAYNNWYGQAAPPTTQFAWLRSHTFNPLYYDTTVTYSPWSPAYVSSASATYSAASTSAAKSHPASSSTPTLALSSSWSSSSTNFSSNGYMFYVQAGMTLPIGTYIKASSTSSGACSGGTWRTLTAAVTVPASTACWAAIPYTPASFWYAETCTVDGTTCITAPDGTTKLKLYEIKSTVTTYPSGRTYANELQNFANWFTYHRKRKLMLAASMGSVLENISGLRMGVVPFASRSSITMYDADATAAASNRLAVSGQFYLNGMSANGTPTLGTIKHIGDQYGSDTNLVQYACQRNATFVVTDGFANDLGTVTTPSYTSATYGAGAPYQTTAANTQADLALSYYTNRLRSSGSSVLAAGKVPLSASTAANSDQNPNLHVNTYAITLGVKGSLWPNTVDPFVTAPTWTTPVSDDPSLVDDLWHATINGRGQMYLATDTTNTAAAIRSGLLDILSQTGAQSGVAVSTSNLSRSDGYAYLGRYNPSGWTGDLTANAINTSTAVISSTSTWSAATLLNARTWSTRVIASHNGSSGVAFTEAAVGSLVNPSSTWGTTSTVMNYLRGDRSLETSTYRTRTSVMGAVMNAEPAISDADDVVYVASSEGMLHAFDIAVGSNAGRELWAFVPNAVLSAIGETSSRAYTFETRLDGTPVIGKTGTSSKLLVAGMGSAGRYYYALDVSTPRSNTESDPSWVKWQFPAAGDSTNASKVGQTLGKAVIANTADGYRVLVTSGYNSTYDGKGRLFVLNPSTGAVEKEFVTTAGTLSAESGLAHVSGYTEDDNTVRYVYGGDLLGNLWRFDLTAATGSSANLVAVLKSASDVAQPVTAPPELVEVSGQRVVLIGTGRLLDVTDFGNTNVQTFYAIADGSTLSSARSSLVQQVYTRSSDTITSNAVNWTTQRGWYMDLSAGEQANTQPKAAYGAVAFTTNLAGATDCSASSYFYVLDIGTGSRTASTDPISQQVSSTSNSSGVNVLLTVDGLIKGVMQNANGETATENLPPRRSISPSKNAWREVRQQ